MGVGNFRGTGARLIRGAVVQIVTERQNADTQDCPENFGAAMGQGQCTCHHPDTKRAYRGRHDKAMLPNSFAERQYAEHDREKQANLMNCRIKQYTAGRGQKNQ